MLGLGNNLTNQRITKTNPVTAIVNAFQIRVLAAGGTFEASACLTDLLTELNNI